MSNRTSRCSVYNDYANALLRNDYRHEAPDEKPLPGAPVVRVAAAHTGTAPGRHGGRDAAAQPVPEPRRRGTVRGRGQAGPAVPAGAPAGHGEPVHGQRHGGRGGAVADHHGPAAVAGRGGNDHVPAAGARRPERGQRVHVGRGRAGHARCGRLRGLLDGAARDHRPGRVAAGTQRPTAGDHMLPEGQVQVFAKRPTAPADGRRPGGLGQVQGGRRARRQAVGRCSGGQGGWRLRRAPSSRRRRRSAPSPSAGTAAAAAPGRGRRGRGHGTETSPPSRDRRRPPSAPPHAPPPRAVAADVRDDGGTGDGATTANGAERHDVPESGQTVVPVAARPPDDRRLSAQRVAGARHAAQTAAAAQVVGGRAVAGVAAPARPTGRGHWSDAQNRYAQDAGGRHERDEGLTVAAVVSALRVRADQAHRSAVYYFYEKACVSSSFDGCRPIL